MTVPLPTIKGVTNAASYGTGAVSPGELVTLFGTAIGPTTAASATTDPSTGVDQVPGTGFQCVSVDHDDDGTGAVHAKRLGQRVGVSVQ